MTKEKLRDLIIEKFVDEHGNVNISGLDFSEFGGSVDISGMIVKQDLLQHTQKVSGDLQQGDQEVGRNLWQDSQEVKGDLHQDSQDVGGTLHQDDRKIEEKKPKAVGVNFVFGDQEAVLLTKSTVMEMVRVLEVDSFTSEFEDLFNQIEKIIERRKND